ncbi:ABC-type Fe3+-hydroxamate transport system [Commensalibacter communis]|uniref:ABC transporter substrate-binding protein n=1 Tax=Commensalibacter communis TaxID=2972786 RepID=UPI0022FF4FAF|nr:ABC transporter substrate-binding protein [Commensalibacter communis]CAI3958702.1 ABC-type Fe3+-hydroxamate transport system [Commensalibacter communis]
MNNFYFPIISKRLFLILVLSISIFGSITLCNAQTSKDTAITVTDMLGRKVTLPAPAKRIVLSESRHVLTLALLDKDPLSRVVGWGNDLQKYSPELFNALRKKFPKANDIPNVGGLTNRSFSMEAVIAAKPDLVIFTLYGPIPDGIEKLDKAGIPYVFVDFFRDPLKKTIPSMLMLGKLLDREKEANSFVSYYEQHMRNIAELVKNTKQLKVLFHLNPDGKDCCFSSGHGNMSDFIAAAGGKSIGMDKIPGSAGKLSLEYIITRDPDFYLVGGGSTAALNGLKIGPSISKEQAEASMTSVMQAPGVSNLRAVRENMAGGVWLFFFDTPLFFVGVEEMAKMFHPNELKDVDPDKTLTELNKQFMAFPLEGTFWVNKESSSQ